MALRGLVQLFRQSKEFAEIEKHIASNHEQLLVGPVGSQKSLLVAALARSHRPLLVITYSAGQAQKIIQDLQHLAPQRRVYRLDGHELFPHEEAGTAIDLKVNRLQALHGLRESGSIVIAPVEGIMETVMDPAAFFGHQFTVDFSTRLDVDALAERLVTLGYERVDMVEGLGQFSIRGGIVDVFPPLEEHPVRIELFDDEVDSMRSFDLENQRSIANIEQVRVTPAEELFVTAAMGQQVQQAIREAAERQALSLERMKRQEQAQNLRDRVERHLELLAQGGTFEGIHQYKPFLFDQQSIMDYLSEDAVILVDEPNRIMDQARGTYHDAAEMIAALLEQGRVLPQMRGAWLEPDELVHRAKGFALLHMAILGKRIPGMDEKLQVQNLAAKAAEHFHGSSSAFIQKVKQWRRANYRILCVVSTDNKAQRLAEYLREEDIAVDYSGDVTNQLKSGNCVITTGSLDSGFELPLFKMIVLTDLEIYGKQKPKVKVKPPEEGMRLSQSELQVGDYVVHVNHGIGQYLGVETLEVSGIHKDYLVVKYSGQDKLYVPTDQIHLLQRYIGLDEGSPRLSKLGGNEWNRVKKRVKESVQEMASGLIKLYAERERVPGYSFAPDSNWQQEFESAFPYQETPDQLLAIEDLKTDMQKDRPMDRLLCGDVGYGKTEVGIRGAFKAVEESKQVAVLVPTTILAQQHHRNFVERFEKYPIKVGVMSRFQSTAETNKVLRGLKDGSVDIVIGTHRILSKDVVFRDLGLVIVDEEQRFGVTQKERLKEMTKHVDVLTMTATPIPRTLHMAMVGVRDMSVIETPPEDRYPIRTYVVEYDDQAIRHAITRELARQGQVYFVHNRVQSIDKIYRDLSNLVPEARIAVAHGQMDEARLERVMLDFYRGEYDVLLCTTIIETGMDIPNVNTLIIHDADYLGLAQLYQLRGRVGRTNRVAYAYFTYRRDKNLTEDAEKRLQAIKEFTDLGSGMKIAMRDLEIRGAGNLLGPEQHGFIASVGFELYCRLLEESIQELKGQVVQKPPEPVIDLTVDAYIDEDFVKDPKQKIELYKKIMGINTREEADALVEEVLDRYGDLPDPVSNLIQIARIKVEARLLGVAQIHSMNEIFILKMLEGISFDREAYAALVRKYRGRVVYQHGRIPQLKVSVRGRSDKEALQILLDVVRDLQLEVAS